MIAYLCGICGHVELQEPKAICSVCGAPQNKFEKKADLLQKEGSSDGKGESEKKHIPVITVVKTCGLIPQGCMDAHVKIGEIEHPMSLEHFITCIELFVDKVFVGHVLLRPEGVHPAGAFHLRAASGEITAVEHCSLHGYWVAQAQL